MSKASNSSALFFWSKNGSQAVRGLCSTDISLCVAYSGVYLDPHGRRTQIAPRVTAQQAFASWASSGFRDPTALLGIQGVGPGDFELAEKSITLPVLAPPDSITDRRVAKDAQSEAERLKRLFSCSPVGTAPRGRGCRGILVFASYGDKDPYWFVLRSCSATCGFQGESVQMLKRSDYGWEVTSGGVVDDPIEVKRLKLQIEKAAMLRLQF